MAIEPQNAGMGTILMEQSRALEQNKTQTVKEIASKASILDEKLLRTNIEMLKLRKDQIEFDEKSLAAIQDLTKGIEQIRGPIARMVDGIKAFVKPIGDFVKNPGRGLMKAFNFGGIFNKSIAKSEFVEQQKRLGSSKSTEELSLDFAANYDARRNLAKTDKQLQYFRDAGMNDEQIARTEQGSKLLKQRDEMLQVVGNTDIRSRFATDENFTTIQPPEPQADSATGEAPPVNVNVVSEKVEANVLKAEKVDSSTGEEVGPAPSAEEKEQHLENVRQMDSQNEILERIEANTRGLGAAGGTPGNPQPAAGGGGLMGKIGEGIKGFGGMAGSLLKGALGLVGIAGALWIVSKALDNFADLEWETLAKGVGTIGALAAIGVIAGKASGSMLMGALGLAAITGVMWLASKALSAFEDIGWDTVAKGLLTLAGVGVIGAIAGTAAPLIIAGAVALGLMGGALWIIGEAMEAIGEGMNSMTTGLERLGELDGGNLLAVAAGITAIGASMVAFAAGNVLAGLGNLVTKLLSFGQDTPVEQLIKIGQAGDGIQAAADGLDKLGLSMATFADVDAANLEKAMDALGEAPWRRMTAFVQAGGYMNSDGTIVTNASAMTAAARDESAGGGGNINTVVAPTSNNNVSTSVNTVSIPVRNTDSTIRSHWNGGRQYAGAN